MLGQGAVILSIKEMQRTGAIENNKHQAIE
jgi:hypothetical protein